MTCPKCNKNWNDPLAKFSIEKAKMCPTCYKKWCSLPENDPENKRFLVEYEQNITDEAEIYAKSEKEAREQFEENFTGEYTDILGVKEVSKRNTVSV